jgi:hypothetical protein
LLILICGVQGCARFLNAIAAPSQPDHSDLLAWAGASYDPEAFDSARVVFDDPDQR